MIWWYLHFRTLPYDWRMIGEWWDVPLDWFEGKTTTRRPGRVDFCNSMVSDFLWFTDIYSIHMYPSSECWSFVLELGIPTAWLFFLCCFDFCNDISSENRRHTLRVMKFLAKFNGHAGLLEYWVHVFCLCVFFWLTIRYDIISSVSGIYIYIYIDGFSRHKVGHGFWFIAMRLVLRIRRTKST